MSSWRRIFDFGGPTSGISGASRESKLWMGLALLLVLAAGAASAQSPTEFATGVTSPGGGLVLSGTAINPATGQPYRHLWTSDQGGFGLCRLDPDVDTPGPHFINGGTCMPIIDGVFFKPGQFAFDPATNNIYAVDLQANSRGIFRLHYIPSGSGGHGSVDPIHTEVLGGNQLGGRQTLPGCGIAGNVPNSAVLGPDGNLYIGFKASGDILRVAAPQTEPLPCANVQVIGTTADGRKNFGLGWIGHDLFGGDGLAAWVMPNADQCLTPQNGNIPCHATNILVGQTATPSFVMSDQIYPALNGRKLFVGNPSDLTLVDIATQQVTLGFATGFQFLSGMALDPTNMNLYVADDPTEGIVGGFGRWWFLGNSGGNIAPVTLVKFADGVTAPSGGAVLIGSGINPISGKPFRHLWSGDQGGFGLCRLDPDIDSPGPHVMNAGTCIPFVAGVQFKPGQMAFDPITNNLYAVDMQANTKGIFRLHFLPDADNGHGGVDIIHQEVLAGNGGVGRNGLPGCGIAGNVPNSAVLGPDGNLYVGFKASGDILRITGPQTDPVPCSNVQVIGSTPDNIRDMGLGWIGHDLFGGDGRAAFIIPNADQCMTPQNPNPCHGNNILQRETANPSFVMSDQMYPALNGRNLLVGQPGSITLVNPVSLEVNLSFVNGFQLLSAITLDPTDLMLFVADDPSAGLLPQQGHWWQAAPVQVTPKVLGAPLFVQGIAEDAAALISWTPFPDGQTITSYTVRASFSSSGVPVPDVIVTAPPGSTSVPPSVTVTGLVNNSQYSFIVAATNDVGTSRWSLPSRLIQPFAPSVPKKPAHVFAAGHDSSATVSWTAVPDYLNGGFPIIVYRVEVDVDGVEVQIDDVPALQTSTEITGLKNGTPYTFRIYATNKLGDSVASLPSNVVVPSATPTGSAPGQPTGVSAVAGNGSASVSWSAPASSGSSPITGYFVHALVNGAFAPITAIANAPNTSATINGLSNGTTYTFDVQAVNAYGLGQLSSPSNAVVPSTQITPNGVVPGVPTAVNAVGGVNSATVSWTAPASSGSSAITNYSVVVLAGGGPSGISINVPAPGTQTVVNGLAPGTSYAFQVHAFNAAGDSGASLTSNAITPTAPPANTVPGVPTNVVASAGTGSASVAWTAPASNGGQPVTSYVVVALAGGAPTNQTMTVTAPTSAVVFNGLTGGNTYTFVVHAINSVGDSGASAPSNAITLAGAPPAASEPDVTVTLSGPTSVPAGVNGNFAITVTNSGPAAASRVTLTHTFTASSATRVSHTISQGNCTERGAKLVCELGGMAPGSSVTLNVALTAHAAFTSKAIVLAWDASGRTVAASNPASGLTKMSTSMAAAVAANTTTDLQISGSTVAAGANTTVLWVVSNLSPQPANTVQFTNQLPSTLQFVEVTSSAGVNCTAPAAGSAGSLVTCSLTSLAGGQDMVVAVTVSPTAGATSFTDTASVAFSGTDSQPANNSASVTFTAAASAIVSLAGGGAVNAGGHGGATGGNSGGATFGGNSSATGPNPDNVSNHSGVVAAGTRRQQLGAILLDANPRGNRAQ